MSTSYSMETQKFDFFSKKFEIEFSLIAIVTCAEELKSP